jgi:hypothetical protein
MSDKFIGGSATTGDTEYTVYDDLDEIYRTYDRNGDLIFTDRDGFRSPNHFNKVNDYKIRDYVISEEARHDLMAMHNIERRTEEDKDNARIVEILDKEFRKRVEKQFKEEIKKLQDKVKELTEVLSDTTRAKDDVSLELRTTHSNWESAMQHVECLKKELAESKHQCAQLVADRDLAAAERDAATEKLSHFVMPTLEEDERILDLE